MIGPIVKLIFSDGAKKKLEMYNRPPALIVEGELKGEKVQLTFHRTGPDEYREVVAKKEEEKKVERNP